MIHHLGVLGEQAAAFQIRTRNVVEITPANLRPKVDVTRRLLDGLESDALIFDELHRDLGNAPDEDMRPGDLRDGVVAVLREPLRIEGLGALVVEDVLEAVILEKRDGLLQFLSRRLDHRR